MARGRFISNTLGDSRKFAGLHDDLNRAAYVLLVTWADAEGRFEADSVTLKGKLYTRLPWTPDEIEAALLDMYRVDLIRLYTLGEKRYGAVVDFHKHNLIRRKEDGSPKEEAPSRIPAPPERVGSNPEPTPVPEPYRSSTGATLVECNGSRSRSRSRSRSATEYQDKDLQPSSTSSTREHHHQAFLDAWNDHRGNLPACTTLNDKRHRALDALRKEHPDHALELFTAAAQQVASDAYWVEQGYGIDNLLVKGRVLEKAEKHAADRGMTRGERKLATTADIIARAIGGIDA
jgi:hypothetical protein